LTFCLIVLASKDIGRWLGRKGFPLITGFLFTGILAGPYLLDILTAPAVKNLQFVDSTALAFIAFIAGSELHIENVRTRLRRIITILIYCCIFVMLLAVPAVLLTSPAVPLFSGMALIERIAVACICASVMVAISPSSVIAVLKELRAKGDLTQTVLGVTLLMDCIVILIFAAATSTAAALFDGASFSVLILVFLLFELILDIVLGLGIGAIIHGLLGMRISESFKAGLILFVGYGVFRFSQMLHGIELEILPVQLFSEPLLVCMTAGLFVANGSQHHAEFSKIIDRLAPVIFMLFFTILGAELELKVLTAAWPAVIAMVAARLIGMWIGGFTGGWMSNISESQRQYLGLAFITQAGVSLSLAKAIGVEFPSWGPETSTIVVAVIVVNTLLGPPLLKFVIQRAGESHSGAVIKKRKSDYALILGIDPQAVMLARHLETHGWEVCIADTDPDHVDRLKRGDLKARRVEDFSLERLRELEADRAEAIVAMLDGGSNFDICELAYEHFGTETIVVRVENPANIPRFRELGVLTIDSGTATVSMLDHAVRSPSTAALLLGHEEGKDLIDVALSNRALHGIALRNLHLPTDVLIMSIHRDQRMILSHGYTRLRIGDQVTLVGNEDSLQEAQMLFES
jgi:Trk K+ transport system NAD-binding subunit/Kef-type K+ transport system membrane component KefB